MKLGWEYKKLCDVAYVFAGQGAPQGNENYSATGTPFIKAGNLEDLVNGFPEDEVQKVSEEVAKSHRLKIYKAGSILFAKSGMSCMKGWVYTLKRDCYVVSHLAIITPKTINSSFLNYYLRHYKPYSLVQDSAYPSISLKDIENLHIQCPNLNIQVQIVSELDQLSSVIEKHKSQLKELNKLAQSVFYDMFGDPDNNPKNFEIRTIDKVCSLKAGKAIKAEELSNCYSEKSYPCYGGNGIRGYINKYSHDGTYPIIGRQGALCGNVNLACGQFYATEHAVVVMPIININTLWLYYVLLSMRLGQYAHGVAQPGLSVKDLNPLSMILPPLSLQQEFAAKIEAIETMKAKIRQSLTETEQLFNSRMDYYFN